MTGPELWAHGDELAQRLGDVEISICGEECEQSDDFTLEWGQAVIGGGTAEVLLSHRPLEPVSYFLYLHELGHLAIQRGPRGFRKYGQRPRLRDEAMAWRWALKHAAIPPAPEVWVAILARLISYGIDRRYKRDHVFDRLLAEAERNANASE